MTFLHLAFFMGLFSSIHCVAMCGPLLLAVNKMNGFSWKLVVNSVLYHLARILTYGVIGFVFGWFGFFAALKGWQQGFSLVIGILLSAIGGIYLSGGNKGVNGLQNLIIQPFVKLFGKLLSKPGGMFFMGVLNGVLPCGLVYVALASAMNADSVKASFLFMLLFGLGTLPLLFVFSMIGSIRRTIFAKKFTQLIPLFYILIGLWFILRGANLDIPFLSPMLNVEGAIYCN